MHVKGGSAEAFAIKQEKQRLKEEADTARKLERLRKLKAGLRISSSSSSISSGCR